VIQAYLTKLGLVATLASTGEEALEAWRAARKSGRPFAAGIFDLAAPGGLGGKETLTRIRAEEPDFRAMVISGYSNDEVMADHESYGFKAALSKPFDHDQLGQVLASILG
jgi:two-component system cell cycle sensor histidine kinase/response regulator CckA